MKAFLLAAGRGTRLRPLTDATPKCLVEIDGIPLLGIWFRLLAFHGVDSILINTHHLPDAVRDYARRHAPAGLHVTLSHEPQLLGSAGTVAAHRDFVRGEDAFFVLYADNLTDADLSEFSRFHAATNSPFTMGLFRTPAPGECGIVVCESDGRVTEYQEKPAKPRSDWANAGLYLAGPSLFELLTPGRFSDFGFDVLPRLVGRMYGWPMKGYLQDIGSLDRLDAARRAWRTEADRRFLEERPC